MINEIVTVDFLNKSVSNTFIVHDVNEEKGTAYLYHPLFDKCFIEVELENLDTTAPNIKDSTEKCLDFAKSGEIHLDYNMLADLEALCLYFVVKRQLTPKQKSTLANICGRLAMIHFNDSIEEAMKYASINNAILDDFNRMWYNNFHGLFKGKQPLTSKKQRAAIFNMAGFALAELTNPKAPK